MTTTRKKKPRSPAAPRARRTPAPAAAAAAPGPAEDESVTLIKKYGNRRLYDTRRSRYVTLEELAEVVSRGEEIVVKDATTGEDVTKRVLTQIILQEEESRQLNLLPLGFLRKLIQFKDDSLREYFQKYLTSSLDAYLDTQRGMAQRVGGWASAALDPKLMTAMFPWLNLATGGTQAVQPPAPPPPPPPAPPPAAPRAEGMADELAELRARLAELENRYKRP